MNYNQFSNLSCYEEFEIRSALTGISKVDILKEIGHKINDYYFFISEDGIFNWFDLKGNHVEDPYVLKTIKEEYIPRNITKCIIPNGVTCICDWAFIFCDSLTSITIPNSVTIIDNSACYNCESLTSINNSDSVTIIGDEIVEAEEPVGVFFYCKSLKEIIFKGKTLDEVKQIENYPFGIEDERIIKCEL